MNKLNKLKIEFDQLVVSNHIGFKLTEIQKWVCKDEDFYQVDGILYQVKKDHEYIPSKFKQYITELIGMNPK
jgi:hypothetical protein